MNRCLSQLPPFDCQATLMTRLGLLFVSVLCVCPAGHAQDDSSDLSNLKFWARPLSSQVAVDSRAVPRATAIEEAHKTSADDENEHGREAAKPPSHTREELNEAIAKRLAAVSETEARDGEVSPALIAPLTALAELYRELGEYDAAMSALEEAKQIARINFGLYSLDQAAYVESLIAVSEAKGGYGEAAGHRGYLRELVHRNSDDPRIVGILSGLADSEMDSARELLGVPAPSVFRLGVSTAPPSDQPLRPPMLGPSPLKPALLALYAARADYIHAIQAAVRTRSGNVADLFALEDALTDTVYFQYAHGELFAPHGAYAQFTGVAVDSNLHETGARILRSKVQDNINFGRSAVEVAKAVVELGDWYLVYSENGRALAEYELAHDVLVKGNAPRETIDTILAPEIPPVLPVLPASVDGSDENRTHRGYIDASIELTRFGQTKSIDVLDKSAGTSKALEKRLRQYVSSIRFRPRFVDGELARSDKFAARFYFDY